MCRWQSCNCIRAFTRCCARPWWIRAATRWRSAVAADAALGEARTRRWSCASFAARWTRVRSSVRDLPATRNCSRVLGTLCACLRIDDTAPHHGPRRTAAFLQIRSIPLMPIERADTAPDAPNERFSDSRSSNNNPDAQNLSTSDGERGNQRMRQYECVSGPPFVDSEHAQGVTV